MKRAAVFPGQGSQQVGMGRELSLAFVSAREVFQEVDDALGQKLSPLLFEGPEETLTLTENAQPAIMAVGIAALRVLEKETGFKLGDWAAYVAGHSLGEYTALAAAGALGLADTARLLRLRGRSMQQSVAPGKGTMAAILGLDLAAVAEIVAEAAKDGVCSVANDNSPGQVVVSGETAAVETAMALAKERGAKRALPLAVSAPFHCSLMEPAARAMEAALAEAVLHAPKPPLVANVTAEAARAPDAIRRLLVRQVTGMVRWRESVEYLAAQGVTMSLELGAGKVLSGLVKRTAKEIETLSVAVPKDVEEFARRL